MTRRDIKEEANYRVDKYVSDIHGSKCYEYGTLTGADVKEILKGSKYDNMLEMWFTPKGTIGYSVVEI